MWLEGVLEPVIRYMLEIKKSCYVAIDTEPVDARVLAISKDTR